MGSAPEPSVWLAQVASDIVIILYTHFPEHLQGARPYLRAGDGAAPCQFGQVGMTAPRLTLRLNPSTIQSHVRSILSKPGLINLIEAVTLAFRN